MTKKIDKLEDEYSEKLQALIEAHEDQWPDNPLEGGVFQLVKKSLKKSEK